ncbi:hypothetical protein V9T40_011421 [Parthenolecanium corni]|uniref:Uncharacterized protein n=1 Tax=Parthenolecanium corni TaxID=536013 RepID=A0AAN9T611_9HEMI
MPVKHLAEGSTKPNFIDGAIYLFSMRFCPYAHRAHLILDAKNVKYEPIYINLSAKPKWYLELFPAGKVPAVLYKGELLSESLLLADFLNDEFAENPLHSTEPIKKFKDRLIIENFGKVTTAYYKLAMVEYNSENFEELLVSLDYLEKELVSRGTKYFGGNDKPLMVDYLIWPWFERFPAISIVYGNIAKIPEDRFPTLTKWNHSMENDPHVKKHFLTGAQYAKHFQLRKSNDPGAFDNVID